MLAPGALKHRIAEGIMAFPATPFHSDGSLDQASLESHVALLATYDPTALVAAGGAGELFSLTLPEHEHVMQTTVRNAGGVPVIGGAGYGTAMASDMARAIERSGADGILLLPPYLVRSEQEGLFRHVSAVCSAVSIAVIPYSRDNAVIEPDTLLRLIDRHPNLIALKDGTGNPAGVGDLRAAVGDRINIVNGAPTAEVFARQYQALGVNSYSSAVFSFLPLLARRFYDALRSGDKPLTESLLAEFYTPLVKLRDRKHGFAVSIMKAGLRVVGKSAGPVRPPLVDLDQEEEALLAGLVAKASKWNR